MEDKSENTVEGFSILEELGNYKHSMMYRVEYGDGDAILAVFHKKYAKNSQFRAGFEKVKLLYKQMNHPSMLRVYKWRLDKDNAWVLMETCDQKLIMEEPRKKKERFTLLQQLTTVIDEAHQKQFYHGGLSQNVLFLRSDGSLNM